MAMSDPGNGIALKHFAENCTRRECRLPFYQEPQTQITMTDTHKALAMCQELLLGLWM